MLGCDSCARGSPVDCRPRNQLVHELHGERGERRAESLRKKCQEHVGHCASYNVRAGTGIHRFLLWGADVKVSGR